MAKKDLYKFTIQFNSGDPQHQQTAEILNRQGRRKAQFIVNAVLHYLHCSETPDIPQPAPIDIGAIEKIVRRIMEKQSERKVPAEVKKESVRRSIKSEQIDFGDAAVCLVRKVWQQLKTQWRASDGIYKQAGTAISVSSAGLSVIILTYLRLISNRCRSRIRWL